MSQMTVTMNIEETPWQDLQGVDFLTGEIAKIGLMPNGTALGEPAAMLQVTLSDGRTAVVQTTWRLLRTAVLSMDAAPNAPKLRDIP